MRVLVLGGYGFIGAEVARFLAARGHAVVGLGRSAATGRRMVPEAAWREADLRALVSTESWAPLLADVEAVVNAAGALQDGPGDDLHAVHVAAVGACLQAADHAGARVFVQISAVGAEAAASTVFLRTKAEGDALVRASALDWVVLKPGLVVGRDAWGGTALLRLLAGFPLIQPIAHADAPVQTVYIDDVASAVLAALDGAVGLRRDYDLVEDAAQPLSEVVRSFRRRLGFAPARAEVRVPDGVAGLIARGADLAGLLGWRSPLRSTAMAVLSEGVTGDAAPWRAATGRGMRPLAEALRGLAPSVQERLFARVALVAPAVVVMLSAFWIVSGLVGALRLDAAAALLPDVSPPAARALVLAGAAADLAVGAGFLLRRTMRAAALGAVALSLAYLVAGTFLAPALWADPLGPYVKILPAALLAAVAALVAGER